MQIQLVDKRLAIRIHRFNTTGYDFITSSVYEDILTSTIDVYLSEPGTWTLELKKLDEFNTLFEENYLYIFERIVTDTNNRQASKLFVLMDAEYRFASGLESYILTLFDLNWIKTKKISGVTQDAIVTTDPDTGEMEDLPDYFYKWIYEGGTSNDCLLKLYTDILISPQELAYGQLLPADINRRIKGLSDIENSVTSNTTLPKLIYGADEYMSDIESNIRSQLDFTYRSELEFNDNKTLRIHLLPSNVIKINIISSPNEIVSLSYKKIKSENYSNHYNAITEENIYSNSFDVKTDEITSLESVESGTGDNDATQDYADNLARSKRIENSGYTDFDIELKLEGLVYFIDYNVGDIVRIVGLDVVSGQYKITQITEEIKVTASSLIKVERID